MIVFATLLLAGTLQADEAPKAKEPAEQKICRRGKETGSRLRAPRTCRTRAEWAEIDAAAQRGFENARAVSRPGG